MLTFIHAADFHIDSPLRGLARYEGAPVDEIRQASRRALTNLVDYVVDNKIPLLLIAGDLYDDDCPDFQTLLHVTAQMDRLRDAGTSVALIYGNHDAGNFMTRSLKLPDNVKIFPSNRAETWIIDSLGIAVHGQSFSSAEVLDNLVRSYPEPVSQLFNIGLVHTSLSGIEGQNGYAPCSLNDLLMKKYDYWALGHMHRHEILNNNPYVIFSGCIQGRHIREPGPKGCMRVDVDNSGQVRAERIILDVFRWKILEVDITGLGTFHQVMDKISLDMEDLFSAESQGRAMGVRVELKGTGPAHDHLVQNREELHAAVCRAGTDISRQKIWIEKININTSPAVDLDELKKSKSPQGDLIRFIDDLQTDPDFFQDLNFSLDDLAAKLAGTGVNLPDFNDSDTLHEYLTRTRNIIIPHLSAGKVRDN
ncbi:MAG: DNA repair exonuclease [Desulfonatronovibrio sp. MSAO_Bac4]|nr:MAG: DNA repair exonuclease [Desulfonatronovibrio sp. MSAO_Bac4]